jgi:hypothetical protein
LRQNIKEFCQKNRAQPRHSNRSQLIRKCAISKLQRSQGVTTTSQTRPPNIALSPSAPPRNTLAPARCCSSPNTTILQMIPQSHMCEAANELVRSRHSNVTSRHLTSPHTHTHTQCHKYYTPAFTPQQAHVRSGTNRDKHTTQTRGPNITQSTHNRKHNMRARTYPAATITTPELSPDTATGVGRFVNVPSATCGDRKASQPYHKPAHPTSLARPPPLPETPSHLAVCILSPTPQSSR